LLEKLITNEITGNESDNLSVEEIDNEYSEALHRHVWSEVLVGLGMPADSEYFIAGMKLIDLSNKRITSLSMEEWESIRAYFREQST
jgi:hypothetical protein